MNNKNNAACAYTISFSVREKDEDVMARTFGIDAHHRKASKPAQANGSALSIIASSSTAMFWNALKWLGR